MNTFSKFCAMARRFHRARFVFFLVAVFAAVSACAIAQQQGPLPPPPAGSNSAGSPAMGNSRAAVPIEGGMAHSESPISSAPPSVPVDQIIQKFSQHESEFKTERDNYTY